MTCLDLEHIFMIQIEVVNKNHENKFYFMIKRNQKNVFFIEHQYKI